MPNLTVLCLVNIYSKMFNAVAELLCYEGCCEITSNLKPLILKEKPWFSTYLKELLDTHLYEMSC